MFVDTHLHLADVTYDQDRQAVINRASTAGVTTLVEIAESPETWETAVRLADQYPFVYASLGIHPHHAHEAVPDRWPELSKKLREFLKHPKVVAIGEFGLDYFRMRNTKEQQEYLFRQQLELAKELNKPIVIHCRDKQTSSPAASGGGSMDSPPTTGGNDGKGSAHADIQKALAMYYPHTSYERASRSRTASSTAFRGPGKTLKRI